jgi:hypothetical protein
MEYEGSVGLVTGKINIFNCWFSRFSRYFLWQKNMSDNFFSVCHAPLPLPPFAKICTTQILAPSVFWANLIFEILHPKGTPHTYGHYFWGSFCTYFGYLFLSFIFSTKKRREIYWLDTNWKNVKIGFFPFQTYQLTLSQTSRKKSKTLPFSIFLKLELFCQNFLDSVPNDFKNSRTHVYKYNCKFSKFLYFCKPISDPFRRSNF